MRLPQIGNKKPSRGTAVGKRPDLNRGFLHQGHSRLCYYLPCLYFSQSDRTLSIIYRSLANRRAGLPLGEFSLCRMRGK